MEAQENNPTREEILQAVGDLSGYRLPKIQRAMKVIKPILVSVAEKKKGKPEQKKEPDALDGLRINPPSMAGTLAKTLQRALDIYPELEAVQAYYASEVQDLCHLLEIGEPDEETKTEIAEDIQKARRIRREAKDLSELLFPIYNYARANKKVIRDLTEVMGEVDRIYTTKIDRKYKARTPIVYEKRYADLYAEFGIMEEEQ